jgi:hypothetical protein
MSRKQKFIFHIDQKTYTVKKFLDNYGNSYSTLAEAENAVKDSTGIYIKSVEGGIMAVENCSLIAK